MTKNKRLSLRLTPFEHKMLKVKASYYGMTVSAFVVKVIEKYPPKFEKVKGHKNRYCVGHFGKR